ncbi:MAG: DNA-processing protein DprA [Treponema sp.]|jgi:DNA processing protein|nr:DNA-processing protein DprA [Treponema sp.]
MASILDLIVSRIPCLKGDDAKKLISAFDRIEDLTSLTKENLEHFLGHSLKETQAWDKLLAQAEMDEKSAALRGIKTVSLREEKYPPLVREIFDPPAVLFYRGSLPVPEQPLVALVGTRKPSSAAAVQAFVLGRELGRMGVPVVSGLALGIDALAHKGNIEGGGAAVAVLGSGPDMVFPVSNRHLARRILETGGCILAEYAPGTVPMKWHFPARNRIISALSRCTVIIEAPQKSGALITADFALEHNRELMVAAVGARSRLGKGTERLAEEGAKVVSSGEEIMKELMNISL